MVVIPIMLAVDFGGIYHWSQYLAAIGILLATFLALPGLTDNTASTGVRQHAILLPLGLLACWACVQSHSMPASVVTWLSPGSYAAYTEWLDGYRTGAEVPGSHRADLISLSVSPYDTAHAAAVLVLLLPLCWAGSIVFHARSRLKMLLSAVAIAGASVAILGVYRKLDPTADLWIFQPRPHSFGGFVNRNNAALMLNFGMAASLGLLSWRMMALHQIELDTPEFEFNDLFSLITDRESMVGLLSATTCMAGLLINGSRGGLVAALFGMTLAFGYVRPRRGLISLPILMVVLAISVTILITPMDLNLESLQRWEVFSRHADTLQSDGRILHWQDGWRAARAYLPGGAGLSTYAYAYLPYQHYSPSAWYEHADNLWLETLVETGLVGVAVGVMLLALLLVSLKRLSASVDPLDQGIRVAGWYAIAAILVSQFFDYGLALPANLIIAVLLGTAIISRDTANGGGSSSWTSMFTSYHDDRLHDDAAFESPPEPVPSAGVRGWVARQGGSFTRVSSFVLAVAMVALAIFVLPGLRQDAITDSMLSRLNQEYSQWQLNPNSLAKMEEVLSQRVTADPSPLLLMRLSKVQRDRAHIAETQEWRPQSNVQMREIYQQTDLRNRQRPYPPNTTTQRLESMSSWQHYTDAWDTSIDALQICPLAQTPRGSLMRLSTIIASGAANGNIASSELDVVAHKAAQQLLIFYNGNSMRQFALGQSSIARGDFDTAAMGLRSAVETDHQFTPRVMELLRATPQLNIADVIPENSEAMRLAASDALQWDQPDLQFLRHALTVIHCDEGESMGQRAACQALLGRIHFVLDNTSDGQEHYQQAIRLAPHEADYRVEYIDRLLQRNLKEDALQQARLGRQSITDDPRFQEFVDQIAKSERTQTPPPDAAPAIDRSKLDALLEATPR